MNSTLHLLGIARKAGKLELGEEPTGAAARAKQAKLIVVARDAAENTFRRVRHFADAGNVLWVSVPFTKTELGGAVGRNSCAMLAVMDVGLASAIVQKLAAEDPEKYSITAEKMEEKAARALQRQKEKRAHEKNLREGKRKPWAAPPKENPPRKAAEDRPQRDGKRSFRKEEGKYPARKETGKWPSHREEGKRPFYQENDRRSFRKEEGGRTAKGGRTGWKGDRRMEDGAKPYQKKGPAPKGRITVKGKLPAGPKRRHET
jgi:ribosomal protein L7Ae-like RNA K-turn-binding protein